MNTQECHAYTVLQKLYIKSLIKSEALKILVYSNKWKYSHKHQVEESIEKNKLTRIIEFTHNSCKWLLNGIWGQKVNRIRAITECVKKFRYLRRMYKQIGEFDIVHELRTGFERCSINFDYIKELLLEDYNTLESQRSLDKS